MRKALAGLLFAALAVPAAAQTVDEVVAKHLEAREAVSTRSRP